jgi:hypothetical protein
LLSKTSGIFLEAFVETQSIQGNNKAFHAFKDPVLALECVLNTTNKFFLGYFTVSN